MTAPVDVVTTARCHWTPDTHTGCGWTQAGDPDVVDRAADKHTATTKHGTTTSTRPVTEAP